tara:strand:+ start:7914 stop:8969 length:1056 start_codon:yes stop_codon:yes gene_type:complete
MTGGGYRYLFVIQSLQMGGAERSLVNLANFFARRGERVAVLRFTAGGLLESELDSGIPVHPVSGLAGLRAIARRYPGATLVSFLFHCNVRLAALKKAGLLRNRLIITEHSSPLRYAGATGLKSRLRRALGRLFLPAADAVFAVSPLVKQDFSTAFALPPERVRVVPNPFDQGALKQAASHAAPTAVDQLAARGPLICGVGRLVAEKGFDVLIRAFAGLSEPPPCTLVIVGDGPERATLEALIEELGLAGRVHLAGFDTNPYRYMARAELLVVPSRQEGFGNVIIEAAMLGVPVIATDCIGPRYIYGDQTDLVPPDDALALTRAIQRALTGAPPAAPDYQAFLIDRIAAEYE